MSCDKPFGFLHACTVYTQQTIMFDVQGAALTTMCGLMTYGRKQWDHLDKQIRSLLPTVHDAMVKFTPMIDDDAAAFNEYMVITLFIFYVVRVGF